MSGNDFDAEIHALHGSPIESDRRREFMDLVAASFDAYVHLYGQEPDGICFAMGGIRQSIAVNHLVQGDSRGAGGAFKAAAIMHITASADWT